jgi:hypothetical protein
MEEGSTKPTTNINRPKPSSSMMAKSQSERGGMAFDDAATAASDGQSSSPSSSSSDVEGEGVGEGEAFERRSHVLFPALHAEFDGLDPLSI